MKLKIITGMMLAFFLIGMLTLALSIQPAKTSGTIYIRADGSVDPSDALISSVDNVTYTFTSNINDSIVVEKDNIVVDGAGYTLQGTGSGTGIALTGRSNVTIKNMEIKAFYQGIRLLDSSNNIISENNITANKYDGIELGYSLYNSICGNNITNNILMGIGLIYSSNNILRGNSMTNNKYSFGVSGWNLTDYINNVDTSNTVNGKPIYYWINKRDMAVPSDAGHVALVNCTRITVQNLNLKGEGIRLAYTTRSTIIKNNRVYITLSSSSNNDISENNADAIYLGRSSNNTICENNITAMHARAEDYGIWLWNSSNNIISGNNVTATKFGPGIWLTSSYYNSISANNIINNIYGIRLDSSSNNKFYRNNFINNTPRQVLISTSGYANFWDDGYPSGGNYWSDFKERYPDVEDVYSGPYQNETGSDGIWDRPYVIDENNQDNYPIVPEFPAWTSILLILMVLTVAITINKWRLLKAPIH